MENKGKNGQKARVLAFYSTGKKLARLLYYCYVIKSLLIRGFWGGYFNRELGDLPVLTLKATS